MATRRSTLHRIGFGALLILVVGLQGVYFVNMVAWRSAPDTGWMFVPEFGPKRIGFVTPVGERAGLQRGDQVLTINGRSYQTSDDTYELKNFEIGGTTHYELERDGQPLEIAVTTERIGIWSVVFQSGLIWLVGTLWGAIGFVVFAMKPDEHRSWAFLLMSGVSGLFVTYMSPSWFYETAVLDNVVLFSLPIGAATVQHLALVFPQKRSFLSRHPGLLPLLYSVALGLAILTRSVATRPQNVPEALLAVLNLYLLGSVLFFAGSVIYGFRRRAAVSVRVQSSVILAGIVVAMMIPALELVCNALLKTSLFPNPILFYVAFLLFFPLSIGYAIVRHDLFEINAVVRRTYGYVLSTATVVGAYALTVSTLNATFQSPELAQTPGFSIAFVLGIVFVVEPGYRRLQDWVARTFYRQRYDYRRTLRGLSETMTGILDPATVQATLVDTVTREMFLEHGALLRPTNGTLEPTVARGRETPALDAGDRLVEELRDRAAAIFRHEAELNPDYESSREALLATFDRFDAELVLGLRSKDELRGLLLLGRKKSGRMFTREDLDLLYTLANQTAVALENATLFDDLAASLKRIQILESIKGHLTKFVPRTVQELIEESPDAPLLDKQERDVSVLFADITGYTRLSTELPLEQVNEIVERYFGAFLDEIAKQGGDVNETAGDGLMVIFQGDSPEEHARACVRAALGIVQRTRELNREARGHPPISMHVGVNSGTAGVGATKIQGASGDRWTYTASGATTNLAARLAALGDGEAVVLSDATRERLEPTLPFVDLGLQSLKNVAEPVRIWQLSPGS